MDGKLDSEELSKAMLLHDVDSSYLHWMTKTNGLGDKEGIMPSDVMNSQTVPFHKEFQIRMMSTQTPITYPSNEPKKKQLQRIVKFKKGGQYDLGLQ